MCGFSEKSIYLFQNDDEFYDYPEFCMFSRISNFTTEEFKRGFHLYNCDIDKWLPVSRMKKRLFDCCLLSDENLIYLIGGNFGSEDRSPPGYVQAYDPRSPTWLKLPTTACLYDSILTTGCVVNGRLFVSNQKQIETFDPRASRWEKVENSFLEERNKYARRVNVKLVSYEEKLYLFYYNSCTEPKYCTYTLQSQEWSPFTSIQSFEIDCFLQDILVFKALM